MNLFYVSDEGPRRSYATLAEAKEDADLQIEYAREDCDPEWPSGVEDVCVYRCEAETEDPEEDGVLVLRATEVNVVAPEPDDDSGAEYYCEYEMRAPS